MYYAADAFAVVFAVADLHGDVDVAITLFCDIMQVVAWDTPNSLWRWVARAPTCVVVCGDVVDRSRGKCRGGPAFGENGHQKELPDDLFLLHLLNHWSTLATAAGIQRCAAMSLVPLPFPFRFVPCTMAHRCIRSPHPHHRKPRSVCLHRVCIHPWQTTALRQC